MSKVSKFKQVAGKFLPFLNWFDNYKIEYFRADLFAGISVALILIPQAMAYAQLAGLPTYYGLYASFLPPIIAALFGSCRQLATGPVAMTSLMTAAALESIATPGTSEFISYAILLAMLVGITRILLGSLKLGVVVNFLSRPVVNGFTNAAALIIATSQLSKIFGLSVEKGEHHYETVVNVVIDAFSHTHIPTLLFAVGSFVLMFLLRKYFPKAPYVLIAVIIATLVSYFTNYYQEKIVTLNDISCPKSKNLILDYNKHFDLLAEKSNERVVLNDSLKKVESAFGEFSKQYLDLKFAINLINLDIELLKEKIVELRNQLKTLKFYELHKGEKLFFCSVVDNASDTQHLGKVYYLKVGNQKISLNKIKFTSGAEIVGTIPKGLPSFEVPKVKFDIVMDLLSYVVVITIIGFMEAITIGKAITARLGQVLDVNQELIGQGLASFIGSFFQSYPVSGSFSRSAVNFQLGAVTGISSVITGLFVGISLLFFAPALYYLPQSVLSSIIILAVVGLINVHNLVHDWRASKSEGVIGFITFVATLYFAPHIDYAIYIGVALSLLMYIYRRMKPEIVLLSKHPDTTFRNRKRFGLAQCKHIAVIRYNGSLVFKNVSYLENAILRILGEMPELKYIVIVGNAINELDASGDYFLASIVDRVREAGYDMFFTGLNDSVLDTMKRTYLYYKIGEDHFFRNVAMAVDSLWESAHQYSNEQRCPLKEVVYETEIANNNQSK